ncbi:MAG: hypothetical protein IJI48_02850 [Ruminococcus sp.]|nr:hypothetical protein [Ruminococcus sp.]MBQ7505148.1 hypothetical protein [Ruminococcus sp.]
MNFENTQNRFRLLSGLSETECEQWNSVMSESSDYVNSIVVKKELTEADKDRLGNLAGVLAYCKYMMYSIEGGSGFRAGELTVNADRATARNVNAMWQNELRLNSDLVSEKAFVFERVIP